MEVESSNDGGVWLEFRVCNLLHLKGVAFLLARSVFALADHHRSLERIQEQAGEIDDHGLKYAIYFQ
jgi:hypothetical protein